MGKLGNQSVEDYKKRIVNRIQSIGRRHGAYQVFEDFVQMAVCVCAVGTYESEYFKRIKRYNQEELIEFSKVLGDTIILFNQNLENSPWCDFLGEVLEDLGLTNQNNGQFLTPIAICSLMAQMQGDYENKRVLDPSVGTGRLLLATINSKNSKPKYVEGIDLDLRACNISALNLVFHGVTGRIVWGNSLTLETYRVYEINMYLNQPIRVIEKSNYLKDQQEVIHKSNIDNSSLLSYGDLFS